MQNSNVIVQFATPLSRALLAACVFATTGCFTPTFAEGLGCTEAGECPSGQSCFDGFCFSEDPGGDGGIVGNLLTSLEISRGALSPAFDPAVTVYSVDLGRLSSEIQLTATAASEIEIGGSPVSSGAASDSIPLEVGSTTIDISVGPDSATMYTITVARSGTLAQETFLKAENRDPGDEFGTAIATDGDTLVIGAPHESSDLASIPSDNSSTNEGAAYVFVRSNGVWRQQQMLKGTNSFSGDTFGTAVAIDGDTIAVGGPRSDGPADQVDSGACFVFERTGTTWSQVARLTASNSASNTSFGRSVTLSKGRLLVGRSGASGNGTVHAFEVVGGNWQELDLLESAPGGRSRFSEALALENQRTAIGGPGLTGTDGQAQAGAAYVYEVSGTDWAETTRLLPTVPGFNDSFGSSLALQGDTIVVGAPGEDSAVVGNQNNDSADSAGAAFVFTFDGNVWSQTGYLKASNVEAGDQFGSSVAIDGNIIAVGANFEASQAGGIGASQTGNGAVRSGAVYLFELQGGVWTQILYVKTRFPGGTVTGRGDEFGATMLLSNGELFVGAVGEDSNATLPNGEENNDSSLDSGAAYLFH